MYCGEVTIPRDSISLLFRLAEKFKIKGLSQQQDPELDKRQVVPDNVEGLDDGSVNINAPKKLKRKFPKRSNLQTKKSTSSVSLGRRSDSSSCVLTPSLQTVAKSSVSLKLTSKSSSCVLTPPLQTVAKSPVSQELPSNATNVIVKPSTAPLKNKGSPHLLLSPADAVPETLTSPARPIVSIPVSSLSERIPSFISRSQMPILASLLVGKSEDTQNSVPLKTVIPSSRSSTVTGTSTAKHNRLSVVEGTTFKFFPAGRTTNHPLLPEIKDEGKNESIILGPDGTLSILGIRAAASDMEVVAQQAIGGVGEGSKEQASGEERGALTPPPDVLSQMVKPCLKMSEIKEEINNEPFILGPDDPLVKDDYDDELDNFSNGNTSMLPEMTSEYASTSSCKLGGRRADSDQDPGSKQVNNGGGGGEGSTEQISGEKWGSPSSPPDSLLQIVQPCMKMREIRSKRKEGLFTSGLCDSLALDDDDDYNLNNWSDDDSCMLPDLTYLVPTSTPDNALSNKQAAVGTETITEQANGGAVDCTKEQASGEKGIGPSSLPIMLSKTVKPFVVMREIGTKRKEGLLTYGLDDSLALDDDDDDDDSLNTNWSDDDSHILPDLTLARASIPNYPLSNKQAASGTETITIKQAFGGAVECTTEQASDEKGRDPSSSPIMLSKIVKPFMVMPEVKEVGKKRIATLGPSHPLAIDGDDLGNLSDNTLLMPKVTSSVSTPTPNCTLGIKQATSDPEQACGGEREGSKEQASGKEGRGSNYPPDVLSQRVQPCVVLLSRLLKSPEIKKRKKERLSLGLDDLSDGDTRVLPDLTLVPNSAPNNALSMKQRALDPETVKQEANGGEGEGSKELANGDEGGGLSSPRDVLTRTIQPFTKMQMSSQRRLASAIQPKNELDSDEMPHFGFKNQLAVERQLDLEEEEKPVSVTKKNIAIQQRNKLDSDEEPLSVVKTRLAVKRQLDLKEEEKPVSVTKKIILESDSRVGGCPQGRLQKPKANTHPCPIEGTSKEKLQKKKLSASEVNKPKPKMINDGITMVKKLNTSFWCGITVVTCYQPLTITAGTMERKMIVPFCLLFYPFFSSITVPALTFFSALFPQLM
ncbi:uncharacterized protein LOC135203623 [Macrobrachium nipponense]|uniref:uncharacterized protein LOC135203623 n=1 Tax=Macrobrachium nipponense TaxID=159736 RepID=UPI0030C7B7AA